MESLSALWHDTLGRHWVKAANALGNTANRYGLARLPALAEAELLQEAERLTGLSGWGDDDFRTPLALLLRDLEEKSGLHALGRLWWHHRVLTLLVTRLLIEEHVRRHPHLLDTQLARPVFVLGLPRTGTTFLYRLLSQDPAARWASFAEMMWPAAVKAHRHLVKLPALLGLTAFQAHYWARMRHIHPMDDHSPEEDVMLFQRSFVNPQFPSFAYMPRYNQWIHTTTHFTGAVGYHRKQLQVLQHTRSGRNWLLKNPTFAYFGRALLDTFPDAAFIHTHRDVKASLASMASYLVVSRSTFSTRPFATERLGKGMVDRFAEHLRRAREMRSAGGSRFLDVDYEPLVKAPLDTVRHIYRWLGYPLLPDVEQRMKDWLAADRKKSPPKKHHYSLEAFGLVATEVEERLGKV